MSGVPELTGVSSREATAIVAGLAGRQHGVITRKQALEAGLPPELIASRVRKGWLVLVFRGVYAVGLAMLDRRGRWMAATLAAGPEAVLSRRSAAALHGLIAPRSGPIEVTRFAGGSRRKVSMASPGSRRFNVVVYRTKALPERDVTIIEGIPVTSLARTTLDLAASESLDGMKSVLGESERLRIFSRPDLIEVAERGRGWPGTTNLQRALSEWDPQEVETRTKLEEAMLRLCRAHGLPTPEVNSLFGPYLPDFLWREARLIVEVDGFETHGTFRAFKGDRRRDVDLMLERFRVARFAWDDLVNYPDDTAARIRGLLEMV
ncbi:MAG: type IV toxin-antitoxin system AbiEi family antitoxin domain-containing protein [Thermoleophilia bacterium]|nr:type IV toxin-antitoxin system AbiEi family antitoxin domain-containing protein [Thermoleophilia bacterium]